MLLYQDCNAGLAMRVAITVIPVKSFIDKLGLQELLMIKEKISQQADLEFNSVLVNYYRDGQDSMGWHADDEKELGKNPTIAALSFGGERDLVFKNILSKETLAIPQLSGALIIIDGQTQQYWQHSIKKTKKFISPRINLTFRNIMFKN